MQAWHEKEETEENKGEKLICSMCNKNEIDEEGMMCSDCEKEFEKHQPHADSAMENNTEE